MTDELPPQAAPPFWEALSTTRVQMARIETKLDMVLEQQGLMSTDLNVVKAKQIALEAGRAANAADTAAAKAEAGAAREQLAAYDISPTQFKTWKAVVDNVVSAFNNMEVAVKTRNTLRAQDWALLMGIAAAAGAVLGNLPAVVALFGWVGFSILGVL